MNRATAIHRLIRRAQQRNRVVGRSQETGLSLTESHLLIEVDGGPERGVSELSAVLKLAQGFTSRLVQGLSKRKLLLVVPVEGDARRRKLILTEAGRKIVAKTDLAANARYHAMVEHLTRAEEQRVVWLFKSIADGMGTPSSVHRPHEPIYRPEQRRLTRACGFLSESMFGSTISSTMWQVLGEVVLSPVPPQPGELATLLSLASNSVSSIVSHMELKGLVRRAPYRGDGRSVVLHPLAAGEKLYREVESAAAEQIAAALKDQPTEKVARAVEALQHFVNDEAQGLPSLPRNLTVEEASSDETRRIARGFIARALVRENLESLLPEHLVARDHSCFLLRDGAELLAVVEGDPSTGRINSCGWGESVSAWCLSAFIARTFLKGHADHKNFARCVESFAPLREFVSL